MKNSKPDISRRSAHPSAETPAACSVENEGALRDEDTGSKQAVPTKAPETVADEADRVSQLVCEISNKLALATSGVQEDQIIADHLTGDAKTDEAVMERLHIADLIRRQRSWPRKHSVE